MCRLFGSVRAFQFFRPTQDFCVGRDHARGMINGGRNNNTIRTVTVKVVLFSSDNAKCAADGNFM